MIFKTEILDDSEASIKRAGELIKLGEVVAMPTETVYGLAANAFDENAVTKIFKAKGRPADNPLIVHISDLTMISDVASEISASALACAKAFWPGPLTIILPKSANVPAVTSGGLDTVGIRMPSHPAAAALISECGVPLAAPSANLSGSPSPTCVRHVIADMNGRVPAIIDGGICAAGVESTVITFEQDAVKILRPGVISARQLSSIVPDVRIDKGALNPVGANETAASPGMKYKHYSPKAEVIIIDGNDVQFEEYVRENDDGRSICLVFSDSELNGVSIPKIVIGDTPQLQAHNLFNALRTADERGAKRIFSRCPTIDGVGLAVYNRLIRAAGFKVVKL